MSDGLKLGLKGVLAVVLPVLVYWSTMTLPLADRSWRGTLNNFLWIALGIYFIIYLPWRGLRLKSWVMQILVALLAVSVVVTAFGGARNMRLERWRVEQGK